AAADTFRPNPKLNTAQVIMELGKGEALVSFLEGNGTPSEVERAMVRPPSARIGPITPEERKAGMSKSPVKGKYDTAEDRESAFEMLQKRLPDAAPDEGAAPGPMGQEGQPAAGWLDKVGAMVSTIFGTNVPRNRRLTTSQRVAREVTRTVSNQVFGQIAADI